MIGYLESHGDSVIKWVNNGDSSGSYMAYRGC